METVTNPQGKVDIFTQGVHIGNFRLPEPELSAPYRSSQLKTEYQGLKSPPKNNSFSEELRVGEFRLLTNSQTFQSFDNNNYQDQDRDYLLKKRNL